MTFSFRKYGRAGGFLLALLAAACQRQPISNTVAPPAEPAPPVAARPLPLVEKGVSEELAIARKKNISRVAYDLRLSIPDERANPISVVESLSFNLRDNGEPVQLDFKAPAANLHTLTVNGKAVAIDHRNEHLVLPATALKVGRNVAEIDFNAGEQSLNRNADYLYTLLVPDRARTVFPVFDQPDLKATFKLALTVPRRWQAMANAPVVDTTFQTADGLLPGKKTYVFATSDSISTYLFSFAAGKFTRLN